MINIIAAIITGLFVGALARWFYPGAVEMSWIGTILLGIGGSILAGIITTRGKKGFQNSLISILHCLSMALILIGSLLGIG